MPWNIKKISEICDTMAGGTPLKSHKDYYFVGNIPWLRSGEVCQKEITASELFITEKGLKNSAAKLFPKNTVLIAMYGATAGQVGILRFESATNQAVCGILPNKNILPEFLYYFFLFEKRNLIKKAPGNAQPNISQIKIRDMQIPVLPLTEQRRIVKILDVVFEGIKLAKENTERNLRNSKELFESYLKGIFANPRNDWEVLDFENVIEKNTYTKKIKKKDFLENGKFPIVSQEKDLTNGYWNNKNDLYHVKNPVIVFGDHTQILKYVDFDFVLGADGIKILQSKNFICSKFFYYFLKSITLKNLGYARHYRLLKEKQIIFPKSKIKQAAIVAKLDALAAETGKLEEIYQQKLADLEELKKSVLRKTFDGEL